MKVKPSCPESSLKTSLAQWATCASKQGESQAKFRVSAPRNKSQNQSRTNGRHASQSKVQVKPSSESQHPESSLKTNPAQWATCESKQVGSQTKFRVSAPRIKSQNKSRIMGDIARQSKLEVKLSSKQDPSQAKAKCKANPKAKNHHQAFQFSPRSWQGHASGPAPRTTRFGPSPPKGSRQCFGSGLDRA